MRDIDDYSNKYMIESFESVKVRFRRKKILQILNRNPCKRILEIGCGLEPLFAYDTDANHVWTIVEPSDVFYENALCLSKLRNESVKCVKGFFEENSIRNQLEGRYDMIICSSLLHEVEEPDILLKSIVNYCTPNTVVHINVPNADSFHRLLGVEMGVISEKHSFTENNILAQQNTVFDINTLKNIVEANGLRVMESGSYFIKPFSHNQMLKILHEGIITEKELEGLYRLSDQFPTNGSEIFVNCKIMV